MRRYYESTGDQKMQCILVLPESETKPGGFLRGKCSTAPLNSTGYTALTLIAFSSVLYFKNQYLQVRAVYRFFVY